MEIAGWLRELGLERYEQAFRDAAIDAEVLPELTNADLRELGIPLGPRKKLVKAIAALAAARAEPAAAPPAAAGRAAPAHGAERRQLTVMFCDLVGSTRLATRLDPEDTAMVINAYRQRCAEVVRRWGGHVAAYMGDGILVYFGYPVAHEDDAERAVRCGLELTTTVTHIEADGTLLSARIGIATGLVMVGAPAGAGAPGEETVVGEAAHLAARLQALAEPSRVVIARGTRQLVGGLFDLTELGEHELKGFAERVQAWRVDGESQAQGRFAALHGTRLTPLVGRVEELRLLLSCWRRATKGEGQVVLISGEPGIGKSRIVETLRSRLADEPHLTLAYFCSPFHASSALHPILSQLQHAARLEHDDSDAAKLEKLEALLAQGTARPGEAAALLAEAAGIPTGEPNALLKLLPDWRKQRTFEVLLEQLEGLASREPILIVLEDLHWIDPTTQELFDHVVKRIVRLPVMLVFTFRDEFDPPWAEHAHTSHLPLRRLSPRQSEVMVGHIASGRVLPAELLRQIVARTDGVPLFVEELTKAVMEGALLSDADGRLELAGPLSPTAVPATLHDSLMARLDQLASVKAVAQVGAVIGREFSRELIATVIGRPDAEIASALDELVASELVLERGTSPVTSYRFKHALVHEAAYQSLLKSRRQQLHERVARILVERFPETARASPELLANHFGEAHLPVQAIPYWRAAGERAAARAANAEAADHLTRALRLVPALPEGQRRREELDLQLMLGFVLLALRGFGAEEVGKCYRRALALSEALGEPQRGSVARFGLWRYHLVRGEFETADRLAQELKQAAERDSSAETRLISDWAFGVVSFWLGRLADAKAHLQRAAAHDPEYHPDLAARYAASPGVTTRLFLSWTLWLLGQTEPALATMAEALALASSAMQAHSRAWSAVYAALLHQLLGDAGATRRYAEIAIGACERQGIPHFRAQAEFLKGWSLAVAGDRRTGTAAMEQALAQLDVLGNRPMLPYFLTVHAEMLASAGRADEALGRVEVALAECAASKQSWCTAEIHRVRGTILGRPDEACLPLAEAELRMACEIARNQGAVAWERRAVSSLADLWMRSGRADEARALLSCLPPITGAEAGVGAASGCC